MSYMTYKKSLPLFKKKSSRTSEKTRRGFSEKSLEKIWLYGIHPVMSALKNKNRIHERLLILKKNASSLITLLEQTYPGLLTHLVYELVDEDTLHRNISKDALHQGLALFTSRLPEISLDVFLENALGPQTLLCLDHVVDPQNVGAILRSAAAFGIDGLCLTERHSPPLTGALAKAASGALEITPLFFLKNIAQSLELLKKKDFWCLGLDDQALQTLSSVSLPERLVFVLGSEGEGLRRLTRERCDLLVKIPTSPLFPVLNVSVSAAICLYEAQRQTSEPLSTPLREL